MFGARPAHAPISESADGANNDSADNNHDDNAYNDSADNDADNDSADNGDTERAPKRARASARAADEPALAVPVSVAAANLYV
jgi:hypothetical protein